MSDRKVAYAAVLLTDKHYGIAIVEADVAGFALDPSEPPYDSWEAASNRALVKNEAIAVSVRNARETVASSMQKSSDANIVWRLRGV